MHGGLKIYRGSPADARLSMQRALADQGEGRPQSPLDSGCGFPVWQLVATRASATARLSLDDYESWVAGLVVDSRGIGSDPVGAPKGRLRPDARAVRYLEIDVNGPKTWSLAAAIHHDVAVSLRAAQQQAADDILRWFAMTAVTRIGPRGSQVLVPVDELEVVTVRQSVSRAGDPHVCLRMQVNARVTAAGTWHGLHTAAVLRGTAAINGIGHAAVMADPGFRSALAGLGYHVDLGSGEVVELTPLISLHSKRSAQIQAEVGRRQAAWRAVGQEVAPDPRVIRVWNESACADTRRRPHRAEACAASERPPVHDLVGRRSALLALPADRDWTEPAGLDRAAVADEVVSQLRRSGRRQMSDARGAVERAVCRAGLVAAPEVRWRIAEELVAEVVERRGLHGMTP